MLPARLHAASRNGPCLGREVDFILRGAQRLASPCCAEDRKLQRPCGDVITLTQLAHEWRHVDIWHRFVMIYLGDFADRRKHFLQMPAPSRWIVAATEAANGRPRQYSLDAAASA